MQNIFLRLILCAVVFLGVATPARAGLLLDTGFIYFSNTAESATETSSSKLWGSAMIGATVPKVFFIGWDVNYLDRSVSSGSVTDAFATLELGPKIGIYLGKNRTIAFAIGFYPLVSGTHTLTASSDETVRGMAYQAELSYTPQIGKFAYIGFKLVYHNASYSTATVDSTENIVTYSQSTVTPLININFRLGSQ